MTVPLLEQARPYLGELEERLRDAIARGGGLASRASLEALDAGGKRLRPVLVHLCSSDRERALRGGVAVELVHLATLVHDDLIDRAELRRGRPAVWYRHGDAVARATGDYLFARAFGELADAGDIDGVGILARASLSLANGEALQRRQMRDADTTVDDYLARITLKTAKLFEAACLLGSRDERLAAFGRELGVAFQIVDDILDCSGDTLETGKVAGTDLREGTPTLPLILAAREDRVVRTALEGGALDGALLRVASTGALERSRELALEYVRRAREHLRDEPELEELTHLVLERDR